MYVCFSVSLCLYECVYVYVYVCEYMCICVRLCVWIYMCVPMCAYVFLCVGMSVWMTLNECVIPSFPSCMSVIFFPCLPLLLVPWRVAAAGQTSLSFLEEKATSISYEAWPFVCVRESSLLGGGYLSPFLVYENFYWVDEVFFCIKWYTHATFILSLLPGYFCLSSHRVL